MKITLKSLKVSAAMSQETTAYTAIVCVDGFPAFHAINHGHGGCDFYQPVKGYVGPRLAEVDAWCATLPPVDMSAHGIAEPLPMSLELLVGDLIAAEQATKRLNRLLKGNIVLLRGGQILTLKANPTPANINIYRGRMTPGDQIVNFACPTVTASALKALGA